MAKNKLGMIARTKQRFDQYVLIRKYRMQQERDYFASLDVKETFKSAETELREIVYQPEQNSELFKHLKSKYDLPDGTTCIVAINHSSSTIYRATIQLKSNQKIVQLSSVIFSKE